MTIRDRAARALDLTHAAASRNLGIHTETMRGYVSAWLDGTPIKTSIVRRAIAYLEMIARNRS